MKRLLTVRHAALGLAMLTGGALLPISSASAESCQDLWVERNQYYKDAGYCFQTARGKNYFGNGGCNTNSDGVARSRMAGGVTARINQIVGMEAAQRCPK